MSQPQQTPRPRTRRAHPTTVAGSEQPGGPQVVRLAIAVVALLCLMVASVALGSVWLSPAKVIEVLFRSTGGDPVARTIVWSVRLPRTFTALCAGSALATSGLLMQTLFRNPLADSAVLGVSAGASLGVALVVLGSSNSLISIGRFEGAGAFGVTAAAAAGSAAVLLIVLSIAHRVGSPVIVLVAGLMVATMVGAFVSVLMYFSSLDAARSFSVWSLGSFRGTSWREVAVLAGATIAGLGAAWFLSKSLDGLLLGDRYSASLGMNLRAVRILTIASAALLTGATTAFCGPIGFLGLAVPHFARAVVRTGRHRSLIVATALIGAATALACELVAQWPGDDRVLPINAVTALVGAPVVLWVLIRRRPMGSQ